MRLPTISIIEVRLLLFPQLDYLDEISFNITYISKYITIELLKITVSNVLLTTNLLGNTIYFSYFKFVLY